MKPIIAAVDGSDSALAAASLAAVIANALDAELILLGVGDLVAMENDPGWQAFVNAEHPTEIGDEVLPANTSENLTKAHERALASGAARIRTVARSGDPTTEIIEQIRQDQAEMVVVGSRGLGPLSGLLLGSVSQKLAHLAPCSVLIVRGST
jgi:nucleotide-binding universal stress UspA family protein